MTKYIVRKLDPDAPNQITEDEPCFVIRATDKHATDIVAGYYGLIYKSRISEYMFRNPSPEDNRFLSEIAEHLARIHKWQAENPDKVKTPD
jgi:hypothetical protein